MENLEYKIVMCWFRLGCFLNAVCAAATIVSLLEELRLIMFMLLAFHLFVLWMCLFAIDLYKKKNKSG